MIYNLIVNSEDTPEGIPSLSVTVEVNEDDNPQWAGTFGLLNFKLEDEEGASFDAGDWSLPGIDELVRVKIAIQLAEQSWAE